MSTGVSRRPGIVGREEEVAALASLLKKRAHVTVVGAAGVGKSRLAREVVVRSGEKALFCDLTQSSSVDDVVRTVAGLLAIEPGEGDPVDRVAAVLAAQGDAVLVMDGGDRIDSATWDATVTRFLDACPELHVLATARARFRVEGEAVFPLGPLALDVEGDAISPAETLFLRLAEDVVGRDLRENGIVTPTVRALVRALDGIPLALEIAASTLTVLTPAEFLARRSVVLDTPAPAEAWSGGSLRAAFEVSWQRLSPDERDALEAVAVFAGTFDLRAAEVVIGPGALASLARLTDASLVASAAYGERTRFRMFECLRQFITDRARAAAGLAGARSRHAAYFASGATAWVHRGEESDRLGAIEWMLAEEGNLSAVVQRALDADAQPSDDELELAAGALSGLAWLWLGRGPLEPHARLFLEVETLLRPRTLEGSLSVATFLLALGSVRRHLGDFELAARLVGSALGRARELAMPYFEARCLLEVARLAKLRGDAARAREAVAAAAAIGEATGNASLRALVILSSTLASRPLDEPALDKASGLARQGGDPLVIARVELAFGTHFFVTGRPADALEHLRLVEDASDRLRQHTWRALAGLVAGNALAELRRIDEARAKFESTLASGRWTAHRRSEAEARGNLALLDLEAGQLDAAAEGLARAVELFGRDDPTRLFFDAALAAVEAWQSGRDSGAVARFLAARDRARESAAALVVEIELFGEMLQLVAPPVPPRERLSPGTQHSGASRVARRVRESVRAWVERDSLVVGRDAVWFRPPKGAVVSLATRPVLRSLLRELLLARVASPLEAVPRDRLVNAIWPEERASRRSMNNRLSVALSTLRSLGLRSLIAGAQGVAFDPGVAVTYVDEPEPAA